MCHKHRLVLTAVATITSVKINLWLPLSTCFVTHKALVLYAMCYCISKGCMFINYTEISLKLGLKYCISLFIHWRFSWCFICVSSCARGWGYKNDKDTVPAIKKFAHHLITIECYLDLVEINPSRAQSKGTWLTLEFWTTFWGSDI